MRSHAAQIFKNASILAVASLFMRTVGVCFQVYVTNRAGAEAMGLYSLLFGVYGFALTLATSGIHLGVTRLVVEAIGKNHSARVRVILRRASFYALAFGCLASILLFSFAKVIGAHWLKDVRTVPSLRFLAITLPLISLSSASNGTETFDTRNAVPLILLIRSHLRRQRSGFCPPLRAAPCLRSNS